jgi:hypothetical protein
VLRARAFGLALKKTGASDAISARDTGAFLDVALEDEVNRKPAFDYVRANFEKLVAKLPPRSAGRFAEALDGLCTVADRNAFAGFFQDRAAQFEGGRRRYDEALETIDLCIAART